MVVIIELSFNAQIAVIVDCPNVFDKPWDALATLSKKRNANKATWCNMAICHCRLKLKILMINKGF